MKQPEDNKTIELPLSKRRGRPRVENALTPAERAKRYREKQRQAGAKRKPQDAHEAKFELDYTRPTWEEYDLQLSMLTEGVQRELELTIKLENAQKTIDDLTQKVMELELRLNGKAKTKRDASRKQQPQIK